MFKAFKFFASISLFLIAIGGHATVVKLGIANLNDVAKYIQGRKSVTQMPSFYIEPYRGFGPSGRHGLIMAKIHNGRPVYVTAFMKDGGPLDVLEISIIQKLDRTMVKELQDAPDIFSLNGFYPPAVREHLKGEIGELGGRVFGKLFGTDGVTYTDNLGATIRDLKNNPIPTADDIFLDYQNSLPGIYMKVGDVGPSAAYKITVGLSRNVTPEQIQQLLGAVVDAI